MSILAWHKLLELTNQESLTSGFQQLPLTQDPYYAEREDLMEKIQSLHEQINELVDMNSELQFEAAEMAKQLRDGKILDPMTAILSSSHAVSTRLDSYVHKKMFSIMDHKDGQEIESLIRLDDSLKKAISLLTKNGFKVEVIG